jgi:hypothetical protein
VGVWSFVSSSNLLCANPTLFSLSRVSVQMSAQKRKGPATKGSVSDEPVAKTGTDEKKQKRLPKWIPPRGVPLRRDAVAREVMGDSDLTPVLSDPETADLFEVSCGFPYEKNKDFQRYHREIMYCLASRSRSGYPVSCTVLSQHPESQMGLPRKEQIVVKQTCCAGKGGAHLSYLDCECPATGTNRKFLIKLVNGKPRWVSTSLGSPCILMIDVGDPTSRCLYENIYSLWRIDSEQKEPIVGIRDITAIAVKRPNGIKIPYVMEADCPTWNISTRYIWREHESSSEWGQMFTRLRMALEGKPAVFVPVFFFKEGVEVIVTNVTNEAFLTADGGFRRWMQDLNARCALGVHVLRHETGVELDVPFPGFRGTSETSDGTVKRSVDIAFFEDTDGMSANSVRCVAVDTSTLGQMISVDETGCPFCAGRALEIMARDLRADSPANILRRERKRGLLGMVRQFDVCDLFVSHTRSEFCSAVCCVMSKSWPRDMCGLLMAYLGPNSFRV